MGCFRKTLAKTFFRIMQRLSRILIMNLSIRADIPRESDILFYLSHAWQFLSQTDNSWCFIGGNLKCFELYMKKYSKPNPSRYAWTRCNIFTIKYRWSVSKYKCNPNLALNERYLKVGVCNGVRNFYMHYPKLITVHRSTTKTLVTTINKKFRSNIYGAIKAK